MTTSTNIIKIPSLKTQANKVVKGIEAVKTIQKNFVKQHKKKV